MKTIRLLDNVKRGLSLLLVLILSLSLALPVLAEEGGSLVVGFEEVLAEENLLAEEESLLAEEESLLATEEILAEEGGGALLLEEDVSPSLIGENVLEEPLLVPEEVSLLEEAPLLEESPLLEEVPVLEEAPLQEEEVVILSPEEEEVLVLDEKEESLLGAPSTWINEVGLFFTIPVTPLVGETIFDRVPNGDGTNAFLGNPSIRTVLALDNSGNTIKMDTSTVQVQDVYWSDQIPVYGELPARTTHKTFREGNYYLCMILKGVNGAQVGANTRLNINAMQNTVWDQYDGPDQTLVVSFPITVAYFAISRIELSSSAQFGSLKAGDPIDRKIDFDLVSATGKEAGSDYRDQVSLSAPDWYKDSYEFMKPFYWDYEHAEPTKENVFSSGTYYLYLPMYANGNAKFARDCEVYLNGEKMELCTWPYGTEGDRYLLAVEVDITGNATLKELNVLVTPEYFDKLTDYYGFSYKEEIPEIYTYLLGSNDPVSRPEFVTLSKPYWKTDDGVYGHWYAEYPVTTDKHFTDHIYILCVDVVSKVPIADKVKTVAFNSANPGAEKDAYLFYFYKTGPNTGMLVNRFYTGKQADQGSYTLDMTGWGEEKVIPENSTHVADRLSISICCLPGYSDAIIRTVKNGVECFDLDKDGHDDLLRHNMITFSVCPDSNLLGKAYTLDCSILRGKDLHVDSDLREFYSSITFLFPGAPVLEARLEKTSYTYTGKVIHPVPYVTLDGEEVPSDQYTLSYSSGCKNVGTYKVTVKTPDGQKKSLSFKIKPKSLAKAVVTVTPKSVVYNGKKQKPKTVTVVLGKVTLKAGKDYTLQLVQNKNAGTAYVNAIGTGNYKNIATGTFTIKQAPQLQTVRAKQVSFTASSLRKQEKTVKASKYLTVLGAHGKLTFEKTSGPAAFTVNRGTGDITARKLTKKGTYSIKLKVSAEATPNYKMATKTITVKIVVL